VSGYFRRLPPHSGVRDAQDPDANLVKAVFTSNPGVAPTENLFGACKIGHGGSPSLD
jgi:hypothetical protein